MKHISQMDPNSPEAKALTAKLAKQVEEHLSAAIAGPPSKQRQTALRVRGRSFETVELDDDGKIIEPPGPCCHGWGILHAPNCKSWGVT
jgi:hypothetical protein